MAAERLDYPDTTTPTVSWVPSLDADPKDSAEVVDEGILSEEAGGGTRYRYKEGVRIKIWRRGYRNMTNTDRTNLETFLTTVGGANFIFTDWNAAEHTVHFVDYAIDYRYREGVHWDFDLAFRETL